MEQLVLALTPGGRAHRHRVSIFHQSVGAVWCDEQRKVVRCLSEA
ncbi:hypothetical protein EVAR_57003_1, partial [Eumeta japonica]